MKKLEGLIEAEVTGILAFSEKSVIYTAGWNKCINVYRDDKDVSTTTNILNLVPILPRNMFVFSDYDFTPLALVIAKQ